MEMTLLRRPISQISQNQFRCRGRLWSSPAPAVSFQCVIGQGQAGRHLCILPYLGCYGSREDEQLQLLREMYSY